VPVQVSVMSRGNDRELKMQQDGGRPGHRV
jgi:hypothetical protein